ncbi:HIT domain-containing protein [bacterium]|nr:HIT domain-containing protein [bacterium]MBU1782242.1 HIT domain-containing protein [bacterium]MBU2599066.1 HIT domain-containing protein [bacterium]
MEKLWAPWRIKFIEEVDKSKCIFCEKPLQDKDEENYIIYRGKYTFLMMNIYPYNNGHLMVAPYAHKTNLEDLNEEELLEMMKLSQLSVKAIKNKMNSSALNLGLNLGKVAGAGFEHLHLHIVPRWPGDTNFMPVIGETKTISEALERTYQKLLAGIKEIR